MQTRLARPRSGGLGRSCLAGAGYAAILNDRAGHLAQAALHLRRSGCRRAVVSCRFVAAANPGNAGQMQQAAGFQWTPAKIALSLTLFIAAGLAEIAGGWLVWQAVRGHFAEKGKPFLQNKKAMVSAAAGSLCLVGYGILPTAQPITAFGRIYAVYGGFFVALSYAWGWLVDGEKPDKGDCLGAAMAIAGCALAWFWPRPY